MFYLKSEVGGDDIIAFIALRAKVNSLIRVGEKRGEMIIEILNKLKGVNRDAVETIGKRDNFSVLGFYRYLLCVLLSIPTDAQFVKFTPKAHNIRMERVTNKALRNFGNN